MKAALQQQAKELGFDLCRIARAEPPRHAERFLAWLAAGCQGEMGYIARNAAKRIDPQALLPGARSVVCLAASYYLPQEPTPAPGAFETVGAAAQRPLAIPGTVARYAAFHDYHEVLGVRLRALTDWLDEHGGSSTRSRGYVDTGPVLERDIAQRAGVGFVGKHANLVSRRFGNWLFLAEILTTVALEPDAEEPQRCGTCTRCLAACPTGAITAPFQLDARRCIAYLTIELKGSIPVDLRPRIGNRVFGCDDCLDVCPWNRFARPGALLQPHRRADLQQPDLLELIALDDDGFRRRYADTPLGRSKRRGFLRNVCVALGNTGDQRALPALQRATSDPDPLIAEHARWACERIVNRPRQEGFRQDQSARSAPERTVRPCVRTFDL